VTDTEKVKAMCRAEAARLARFAEAFGGRLVSLHLMILTKDGWIEAEE
jgi:hypothetical protein